MATKTYTIRIFGDDAQEKKRTTARTSSGETVEKKSKKAEGTNDKALLLAGYHYAKRGLNTVASYEVSTQELRTGSVLAQQEADFAYQIINDVWNIGESLALGAMAGGAAGALGGAAVGTVFKVASFAQAESKINLQRSVESITLAQNAIRIGAGGDRMGAVK